MDGAEEGTDGAEGDGAHRDIEVGLYRRPEPVERCGQSAADDEQLDVELGDDRPEELSDAMAVIEHHLGVHGIIDCGLEVRHGDAEPSSEAPRGQHVVGSTVPSCRPHAEMFDAEVADELDRPGVVGHAGAHPGSERDRQHTIDAATGASQGLASSCGLGVLRVNRIGLVADRRTRSERCTKIDPVDVLELGDTADA